MKHFISSALISVGLLASASATSVTLGGLNAQFVTSTGAALPNGSLVRIGTMDTAVGLSSFVEWGTTSITTIASRPGRVGLATVNGASDDAAFNNKPIYLWVYNSATASSTVDQAVFRADAATPAWTFPVDGATATVAISSQAIDFARSPDGFTAPSIAGAGTSSTNVKVLTLGAVVPEPSGAILLGMVSLLGLVRRRR